MFYFTKTPAWLKRIYPTCTWQINTGSKIIYLSFDDGPHPDATPFVLDTLKAFDAKATFFCIGKNVVAHPVIYTRIISEGHAVGNHTFSHFNGWKTSDEQYMNDIAAAKKYIDSSLFRPPYGRITKFQLRLLQAQNYQLTPVMWTVLSGDFDMGISREKCLKNVLKQTSEGSIVVFHDSEKAFERMAFALPKVLAHFKEKGYLFEKIMR